MSFSAADLDRRLANLVQLGRIVEIDTAGQRARVQFGDLATRMIPVAQLTSGLIRMHWMPSPGEQVVVYAPGGDLARAFVQGSVPQTGGGGRGRRRHAHHPPGRRHATDHGRAGRRRRRDRHGRRGRQWDQPRVPPPCRRDSRRDADGAAGMTAPETRPYLARADGWVDGRRVLAGEIVHLTPAAAAYENVEPAPPEPTPEPVSPPQARARNRRDAEGTE